MSSPTSAATQEGELPGSRNEFIHWIQDARDQRGILRGFVKYDNEIRTGRNVRQLVHRALQIARGDPAGLVYLVGSRVTRQIATALARARHPLIVTSHLGRRPAAVPVLVELAEQLAIGVLEPAAFVPWIPATSRPSPDAAIYVIDVDPPRPTMPLWQIAARRFAAADSQVALAQIARLVRAENLAEAQVVEHRRTELAAAHQARIAALDALEQPADGVITPRHLTACVRDLLAGTDSLVLTEAITNYQIAAEHLRPAIPGSYLGSGGGSLGFTGGGAVGAKLASSAERTVVSLVGDGSYLFGVPVSAQWVARRYNAPSLTVIYDNRGWAAPKFSTLRLHGQGAAAAADDFHVSFEPEADLGGIAAAAGGAYAATVDDPGELPAVLEDALAVVRGGRSAVISVHLPAV
jgi:acetolactate synthase-1/2/3 large subunit